MRTLRKALNALLYSASFLALLVSCSESGSFNQLESSLQAIPSGSLIITSNLNGTTGPGLISIWTSQGILDRVIYDYTKNGAGFASGVGLLSGGYFIVTSEAGGNPSYDYLDLFNYSSPMSAPIHLFSTLYSGGWSTYLRQMIVIQNSSTNHYYIFATESGASRVARLSSPLAAPGALSFTRDFNFTNNGSCTLGNPYGASAIDGTQNIAIVDSAATGRINILNYNGDCIASSTTANTPTGITYHSKSGKLLVTHATDSSISAHNASTGIASLATALYTSATQLSTPRAIAADKDGYIYVGSDGLDQVIKLYWDGVSSSATYIGIAIGTSIFTQNITSITVVP